MSQFVQHGIDIGGTVLGGNTSHDLDPQTTRDDEPTDGLPWTTYAVITEQKPTLDITTKRIAQALDACGVSGVDVSTLTGGIKQYLAKRKAKSTLDGASTHICRAIADGLFVPVSLKVSKTGVAELTLKVYAESSDGVNAPVTITANVALPALGSEERFGLGAVTVGGSVITGVEDVEINFGIEIESDTGDSIYPTEHYVTSVKATVTINTTDASIVTNAALLGSATTHANTSVVLRKRKRYDAYESDATACHIVITAHGEVDVKPNGGGATITVNGEYDGTNWPIAVSLDQALA